MADFCKDCASEMRGEEHNGDFDIDKIFKETEENYFSHGFLCEKCGIDCVLKYDGKCFVNYYSSPSNIFYLRDDINKENPYDINNNEYFKET